MATLHLVLVGCIFIFMDVESQPLWFNEHGFELDGFEVNRGYFRSFDTKQDCIDNNEGNCIYSNFINPPNMLYIPDETNSYKSSFKLSPQDAIVIAGFAPPLAEYFSITPYVAKINNEEIYASISNHSLHLESTWFVAIVSGDLQTIDLITDWFRTANTCLTTSIYNHYLYSLPIVHYLDHNVEYSIVIRHATSKLNQEELQLIYSQAPALLSWHITALDFDERKSQIVTELNQIKAAPQTDEYEFDLFDIDTKGTDTSYIGQDSFYCDNYNSAQCLSSLQNCNWDEPESIVFKSPIFNIDHNANIFVSGINHINTKNARYCTINIMDAMDDSMIAQISLGDLNNDLYYYFVMFSKDCSHSNHYYKDIMYCHEMDDNINILHLTDLRITEMLSSSNNYGIDIDYIQAPHAIISECRNRMRKSRSNSKFHAASAEFKSRDHMRKSRSKNKFHATSAEFKLRNRRRRNDKPNIIVLMLDDLGWRDVGFNGAEYSTLNIDALALSGLRLNQWYVHPVCTPTRTALYTGRYAFRYNMTIPLDIGQRRYIPQSEDVLQEILSANGYDTHLVGKWHVGNSHWNSLPLSNGFDSFYGFTNGFADYYTHQQCWQDWSGTPYPHISGDDNLRLLNAFFPEGLSVYDFFDERQLIFNNEYFPQLLSSRALDIINGKTPDSDPFYMLFSMGTPHTPIVIPPQNFSQCDISLQQHGEGRYNYCNMMQFVDRAIGDIVSALKTNHLWNNTIIIFTSDNGGIANREPGNIIYGSYGSNIPLRGLKSSPFEGGNRVIGFINGGYIDGYHLNGKTNNKLYHIVDLYETIINGIAGFGIDLSDKYLDSFNIWDSIIYDDVSSPRMEWVWTVNFGESPTGIRLGDWKYISGDPAALAVNDGYWDVNNMTYAPGQQQGNTTEYLFNITHDEEEYDDVKHEEINVVQYLKERLQEIEEEGFTESTDAFEIEGLVIAMLNGVALPYLDLTQEIKIEL